MSNIPPQFSQRQESRQAAAESAASADELWYFTIDGARVLVVRRDEIESYIRTGEIFARTLAHSRSSPHPRPLAEIPELAKLVSFPIPVQVKGRKTKNAIQNSVVLFILFVGSVLAVLYSLTGTKNGLLPHLAFYCAMLSPAAALFAIVYLPLRWRLISSLPSPYNWMGKIGGIGLIIAAAIAVILIKTKTLPV